MDLYNVVVVGHSKTHVTDFINSLEDVNNMYVSKYRQVHYSDFYSTNEYHFKKDCKGNRFVLFNCCGVNEEDTIKMVKSSSMVFFVTGPDTLLNDDELHSYKKYRSEILIDMDQNFNYHDMLVVAINCSDNEVDAIKDKVTLTVFSHNTKKCENAKANDGSAKANDGSVELLDISTFYTTYQTRSDNHVYKAILGEHFNINVWDKLSLEKKTYFFDNLDNIECKTAVDIVEAVYDHHIKKYNLDGEDMEHVSMYMFKTCLKYNIKINVFAKYYYSDKKSLIKTLLFDHLSIVSKDCNIYAKDFAVHCLFDVLPELEEVLYENFNEYAIRWYNCNNINLLNRLCDILNEVVNKVLQSPIQQILEIQTVKREQVSTESYYCSTCDTKRWNCADCLNFLDRTKYKHRKNMKWDVFSEDYYTDSDQEYNDYDCRCDCDYCYECEYCINNGCYDRECGDCSRYVYKMFKEVVNFYGLNHVVFYDNNNILYCRTGLTHREFVFKCGNCNNTLDKMHNNIEAPINKKDNVYYKFNKYNSEHHTITSGYYKNKYTGCSKPSSLSVYNYDATDGYNENFFVPYRADNKSIDLDKYLANLRVITSNKIFMFLTKLELLVPIYRNYLPRYSSDPNGKYYIKFLDFTLVNNQKYLNKLVNDEKVEEYEGIISDFLKSVTTVKRKFVTINTFYVTCLDELLIKNV